jgi:hypothetical protein
MTHLTYAEIANNWSLWIEYVDPDGNMTREEFDAMTTDQKIALQVEAFGTKDHDEGEQK